METDDEPDAGEPVRDEPEEDHQHGEHQRAVLGQPRIYQCGIITALLYC